MKRIMKIMLTIGMFIAFLSTVPVKAEYNETENGEEDNYYKKAEYPENAERHGLCTPLPVVIARRVYR